jgi:hypothetical protein
MRSGPATQLFKLRCRVELQYNMTMNDRTYLDTRELDQWAIIGKPLPPHNNREFVDGEFLCTKNCTNYHL